MPLTIRPPSNMFLACGTCFGDENTILKNGVVFSINVSFFLTS